MTFQVTSHEGSVIISFATSIDLNLIQPHRDLDVVPKEGSLIYSKADMPVKQKNKKNLRDEQSHIVSRVETEVVQCKKKKVETTSKQQMCQAQVFNDKNCQAEKSVNMWPKKPEKDMWSNGPAMLIQYKMTKKSNTVKQEYDKNCQSIRNVKSHDFDSQSKVRRCSDMKCQENKSVIMWPVKPKKDVWLKKCAMKLIGLAKDKNCQATIGDNTDSKSQVSRNSDNNCQEIKRPKKPRNVKWLVTNTDVWLPKQARLCSDKNC